MRKYLNLTKKKLIVKIIPNALLKQISRVAKLIVQSLREIEQISI